MNAATNLVMEISVFPINAAKMTRFEPDAICHSHKDIAHDPPTWSRPYRTAQYSHMPFKVTTTGEDLDPGSRFIHIPWGDHFISLE